MEKILTFEIIRILTSCPVSMDGKTLGNYLPVEEGILALSSELSHQMEIHQKVFGEIEVDEKKFNKCVFDILGEDGERQEVLKDKTRIFHKLKNSIGKIIRSGVFSVKGAKKSSAELGSEEHEAFSLDLPREQVDGLEDLAIERGTAYVLKGYYSQAISEFDKVIKINPFSAAAYIRRGLAHELRRKFGQAVSDYTQAINISPRYAQAYYLRGSVYAQQGSYDRAVSDCTQTINIDPCHTEAYAKRGLIYAKQGNLEQAISNWNQLISVDPHNAKAYWGLGAVAVLKKDNDQAILYFNKAININPQYGQPYYSRAIVYLGKNDFDKAWKDVCKAQEFGVRVTPEFLSDLKKASCLTSGTT